MPTAPTGAAFYELRFRVLMLSTESVATPQLSFQVTGYAAEAIPTVSQSTPSLASDLYYDFWIYTSPAILTSSAPLIKVGRTNGQGGG